MAAAFGVNAVCLAEGGVILALRAAVHLHEVRLRLRLFAEQRGAPDVYHGMAGGAHGDDVFQLLYMLFVVVAPHLVRFQPPRPSADAAPASRPRIGGAAQPVPRLFGQGAAQVRIPAPVRHGLKVQLVFLHVSVLRFAYYSTNSAPRQRPAKNFIQHFVPHLLKYARFCVIMQA